MIRFLASIALLSGIGLITSLASQEAKKQAKRPANEIEALVDQLTEIDEKDGGYVVGNSGWSFLPLCYADGRWGPYFKSPQVRLGALKSLVRLGIKALPVLLDHLTDERPTKIVLKHTNLFGGMLIAQDEDDKSKERLIFKEWGYPATEYTVTVADLCYIAIGQIVNRNCTVVYYQPTNMIFVTSVAKSKKLREELGKEWGNLTPEKHRQRLAHDLIESGNEHLWNGASLRIAFYYPEDLEPLVLRRLSYGNYDKAMVEKLIRNQLYPANTAKERKNLVDLFAAKNGELAREGVRWALFEDLAIQEEDEHGRLSPKLNPRHQARECLNEVFGLPANVKSTDQPRSTPLSKYTQASFVQTLHFDASEKLDRTLRDMLAKTDDDVLAFGCLARLVGRGFDADIEEYFKRHQPPLKKVGFNQAISLQYKSKLGWTRLHAAVDLGVPELADAAIKRGVAVNARTPEGRTALHLAVRSGNDEIVSLLLARNADRDIQDEKGRTAIQLARDLGQTALIKLLEK